MTQFLFVVLRRCSPGRRTPVTTLLRRYGGLMLHGSFVGKETPPQDDTIAVCCSFSLLRTTKMNSLTFHLWIGIILTIAGGELDAIPIEKLVFQLCQGSLEALGLLYDRHQLMVYARRWDHRRPGCSSRSAAGCFLRLHRFAGRI